MRVFISSVARGLETERGALRGLMMALGHQPAMFEDFSAQAVPSRQACLEGVDSADAYILILGPYYGHIFPETGQSATHDEWQRAINNGIKLLVFKKSGVEMESEQLDFTRHVGEYGTGRFWDEFADAADLQTKVVAALRELSETGPALNFQPLTETPVITWKDDWEQGRTHGYSGQRTTAEIHVVGLAATPTPARLMAAIPDRLIGALRTTGILAPAEGANTQNTDSDAIVTAAESARQNRLAVIPSKFQGIRYQSSGQLSVWWDLPRDTMAAVVDPAELTSTTTGMLRLCAAAGVLTGDRYAIAAALGGPLQMVTSGPIPTVARTSASVGFRSSMSPLRVLPDESTSAAAFADGAPEVARFLGQALTDRFAAAR